MLFRWHTARFYQMAFCWNDRGDLWVLKSLWVRSYSMPFCIIHKTLLPSSDFFPVVVTFLRQVPFIGTALTLPYVRDVSSQYSCMLVQNTNPSVIGGRSFGWLANIGSMNLVNVIQFIARFYMSSVFSTKSTF
jgi:hypothetical protein